MKKDYIKPQTTSIDLMHELNIMQVGGSMVDQHQPGGGDTDAEDVKGEFSIDQRSSLWDEEW